MKNLIYVLIMIALLGYAGTQDYNNEVIYSMPENVYELMQKELDNPSDSRLVEEYISNKDYWDNRAACMP